VASSKINIFGYLSNALAIASLCFYPPDKFITELVPIKVSSLFSKSKTKFAFARFSA